MKDELEDRKLQSGETHDCTGNYITWRVFIVSSENDFNFTLQFYPQGYFSNEELNGGNLESLYLYTAGRKTYDTSYHVECFWT